MYSIDNSLLSCSVRLVNEFSNMPVPSKAKQQGNVCPDLMKDNIFTFLFSPVYLYIILSSASLVAAGEKIMKDLRVGVPFEPTYIYKLLTLIKSSLSEKVSSIKTRRFTIKSIV